MKNMLAYDTVKDILPDGWFVSAGMNYAVAICPHTQDALYLLDFRPGKWSTTDGSYTCIRELYDAWVGNGYKMLTRDEVFT